MSKKVVSLTRYDYEELKRERNLEMTRVIPLLKANQEALKKQIDFFDEEFQMDNTPGEYPYYIVGQLYDRMRMIQKTISLINLSIPELKAKLARKKMKYIRMEVKLKEYTDKCNFIREELREYIKEYKTIEGSNEIIERYNEYMECSSSYRENMDLVSTQKDDLYRELVKYNDSSSDFVKIAKKMIENGQFREALALDAPKTPTGDEKNFIIKMNDLNILDENYTQLGNPFHPSGVVLDDTCQKERMLIINRIRDKSHEKFQAMNDAKDKLSGDVWVICDDVENAMSSCITFERKLKDVYRKIKIIESHLKVHDDESICIIDEEPI
jgi:hypothetical protein